MVLLVPMTQAEFLDYAAESIPDYARDKVASGEWSQEASMELSRREFEELLPHGPATPDNHLFTIRESTSSPVLGMLWFAVKERGGEKVAYVYDVSIQPPYQRRGYATRAFETLEVEVASRGLGGIALHVFGHNRAAIALYEKLAYAPTNMSMFKRLSSASG
jgi:ribosomal protein S18 acetylase RimI-like enzyme